VSPAVSRGSWRGPSPAKIGDGMFTIKSMQFKMIVVYLLIMLLAMELVSVFILQSLESYYIQSIAGDLRDQAGLLDQLSRRYLVDAGPAEAGYVQTLVNQFQDEPGDNIMVLDERGVVLGSTETSLVGKMLVLPEINNAASGIEAQTIRVDPDRGGRRLYLASPVREQGRVVGVIYQDASLEKRVYGILADLRLILFIAALIGLTIMVVIGSITARTISGPIREVTLSAEKMASGDFSGRIGVRSPDELGQLAAMFNHLSGRLRDTLGEISREKGKLEAIVTHMADGILGVDRGGTIILTNPAAARMLGRTVEDIEEHPAAAVLAATGLAKGLEVELRHCLRGEAPRTDEFQFTTSGGCVVKAHLAPISGPDRAVSGAVIVLQDITEQERLDALRREFVANVSHELRTPLTTIKSYVETLLGGAVREPVADKFLGVVAGETDRLVRLVNDLLQLSRLDYRQRLDLEPLDIGKVVAVAVDRLSLQARQKSVTLRMDRSPSVPPVTADHDRLVQVLTNLVANALEFTPPDGSVHVEVGSCLQGGREWCLVTVRDTGAGIPKDDLPRVFERFYRVDKARSRGRGGTGLGLAIAREIVEAHGGEISLRSETGQGTEVRILLPVRSDDEHDDMEPDVAAGGDGGEPA